MRRLLLVRAGAREAQALPCLSPLGLGRAEGELDRAVPADPGLVVLSGAVGLRDIEHLGAKLSVQEAERGLARSSIRILAVAADSAAGLLALPSLARGPTGPRLAALACCPEHLRAALGCEPDAIAITQAVALTAVCAAAAGVPAVLVCTGLPRGETLLAARREGFSAALVETEDDAALARAIFATASPPVRPGSGAPG